MSDKSTVADVLQFWFGPSAERGKAHKRWFVKNDALDRDFGDVFHCVIDPDRGLFGAFGRCKSRLRGSCRAALLSMSIASRAILLASLLFRLRRGLARRVPHFLVLEAATRATETHAAGLRSPNDGSRDPLALRYAVGDTRRSG